MVYLCSMDKLTALTYLADNGCNGSEWEEAGMAHAYREVIKSELDMFTSEYLDGLISRAESN